MENFEIPLANRVKIIVESKTLALNARVKKMQAEGHSIVNLTVGEPDFPTPDHVKAAIKKAVDDNRNKYTAVEGIIELRQAICAKFLRENELKYAPEQILVSTGGKQVLCNAMMATVEKGDEVIVPVPGWVSYADVVKLAEGTPIFVSCPEDKGFKLQPQDLEKAITPRTKWVIINSCNNPTGAKYSRSELRALCDVLLKHPHVMILTDDMYEHMSYDGQPFYTAAQIEPKLYGRTLVLNGVSKTYSMTGYRLGYGAGPLALIKAMLKVQSQSTTNATAVVQYGAIEALNGDQGFIKGRIQTYKARRDFMLEALNKVPGLRCAVPEGAFYLFINCKSFLSSKAPGGKTIGSDMDFVEYLIEQGVASVPGSSFGAEGYFRLSYATDDQSLKLAAERIAKACAALKPADVNAA